MRTRTAAAALLAVGTLAFAVAPPTAGEQAPLASDVLDLPTSTAEIEIARQSIVVFVEDVEDVVAVTRELLTPLGLRPFHIYEHALRGFAVDAPVEALHSIADDPRVAYIEADRVMWTAAQTLPRGVDRIDAEIAATIGDGSSIPVDIAIIDTGVASHPDLNVHDRRDCTDRSVEASIDYVEYLVYGTCKSGGSDNDGHGTMVAGVAAARDNGQHVVGVAPGARIHALKALNGKEGSLSDVVAAVDHVVAVAPQIEVANISLVGKGTSSALRDAIAEATDEGVVVVVAAGNDSADASGYTPSNVSDAITVSAITDLDGKPRGQKSGRCITGGSGDDQFASYSNFGSVVDIAAPGSCIHTTTRTGGVTDTATGTSFAAPHVAGAAALRIVQTGRGASSSRTTAILNDLLSTSAAEGSTCGYTGSPSNEKLLDLRKGC